MSGIMGSEGSDLQVRSSMARFTKAEWGVAGVFLALVIGAVYGAIEYQKEPAPVVPLEVIMLINGVMFAPLGLIFGLGIRSIVVGEEQNHK